MTELNQFSPFKMKVSEKESDIVQKTLFEFGYNWDFYSPYDDKIYPNIKYILFYNFELSWTNDETVFLGNIYHSRFGGGMNIVPEITFSDFINN